MRRLSIRTKLFLSFTLCVNLIIGLLSYLYYQQTANVIWERNTEASHQMMLRFGASVDLTIKEIDRVSAQILYDPDILDYFTSVSNPLDDNSYNSFFKLQKLEQLLQKFNGPALLAKRIIIFNLDGDYVDYGLTWDTYNNFKDRFKYAPWIANTFQKGGDRELVPPRPTEWQSTGELVFSIARAFNHNTVIEVQQPYTLLEQIVTEGLPKESAVSMYIYDETGRIYYPYGLSELPFTLDNRTTYSNGMELTSTETGQENVVNLLHSNYTGLTVAMLQPKADLLKPIHRLLILSFIIIGAAEILALFLSYWIAKTITSPILKLQRYVRKIDLAEVPFSMAPLQFKYSYEVNELYETFMKMTLGFHTSMNQVIDLQNRENISQMQALYAQMNPHFLYNTLTSIGRLAEESADPKVAQMCYKLTQMMRYSTHSISIPVAIKEELIHAISFLELMKMRFEYQFQYEVLMDPSLDSELVPKLLLQPFLENCFTHGFQKVEPPWSIRIEIVRDSVEPCNWSLSIRDNGIGFEEAALTNIQRIIGSLHFGQRLELQQITGRGLGNVGLENTLTRCQIFWKDSVRFSVCNLQEGVEIKLTIHTLKENA